MIKLLNERLEISNWYILTNDGTDLTAKNTKTNESFSDTTALFNSIFMQPAIVEKEVVIFETAVPVMLASSGSITTAGVLTVNSGNADTYSGGCWVYLPAGTVVGGAAGFYWVIFSNTTTAQVYSTYRNANTGFVANKPIGTQLAAVGSNDVYTAATTITKLQGIMLPANLLTTSSSLSIEYTSSNVNDINDKTITVTLGGTALLAEVNTTTTYTNNSLRVLNRGVLNKQVVCPKSGAPTYQSIDTSANNLLSISGTLEDPSGNIVIESLRITIQR